MQTIPERAEEGRTNRQTKRQTRKYFPHRQYKERRRSRRRRLKSERYETKGNKTRRDETNWTKWSKKCNAGTEEPFLFHNSSSYTLFIYIHMYVYTYTISHIFYLGYLVFYISLCSRERNKRLIEGRRRLCSCATTIAFNEIYISF